MVTAVLRGLFYIILLDLADYFCRMVVYAHASSFVGLPPVQCVPVSYISGLSVILINTLVLNQHGNLPKSHL